MKQRCKWPMYKSSSLTDECGRTTRFYIQLVRPTGLGPTIEVCGVHLTSALISGRSYRVDVK
jgi:hypothetical protein